MTLIEQVKEDSQMLFDKRDVIALLEKQKAEDAEKACIALCKIKCPDVSSLPILGCGKSCETLKTFYKSMKGE